MSEFIVNELQHLQPLSPEVPMEAGVDVHPLLALADRVRSEVGADDGLDLPTDFARNHDRYIHAAAKRQQ